MLVGRVEQIRDAVTFQMESVAGLEKEFRISVDEYLAFCQERGSLPEKPLNATSS
jgi:predicted HicB family RNase H-like nuclease